MNDPQRGIPLPARRVELALLAALALWTAALWPLHDDLAMWVEGMPAYVDQLLGVLRRACTPSINAIDFRGRWIPLTIDPYQGSLMTYLDVPVAWGWVHGWVDDLYAYRYKGILLLALNGWLLFILLRRITAPSVAALGAILFVTLPANAVIAISDLQYHVPVAGAVLAIVAAAVRYAETERPAWLFATAFAAGFALLTRAEALVWTTAAGATWLVLARREAIRAWWHATANKGWLAAGAVASFLLGAAPVVAMNAIYPDYGLLAFLAHGSTVTGGSGAFADAFAIRIGQFTRFVLLSHAKLFDAKVPDYLFAVIAAACLVALAAIALRERRWPFALVALAVVLPLSVIANRGPREIHLLPLLIPVVAATTEAIGRLPHRVAVAAMGAIVLGNLVVFGMNLQHWHGLREAKAETVVSHSCPECLARALEPYRDAALRFTNIGLYQEALWASRARLCGVNILHWGDERGFADAVRKAVENRGSLVFVGFPKEREHAIPGRALARAQLLADTLQASGARYRERPVAGPDGRPLYLLTVLD